MKLNKVVATLATAAGLLASSMASASVIKVDFDGAGSSFGFAPLDTFYITPIPSTYNIALNLGSDLTFSSGDTFSETITYKIYRTDLGGSPTFLDPSKTFTIQAALTGFVGGVSGPAATLLNPASLSNIINGDTWSAFFTGGSISFLDAASTLVASATVVDGGSSQFLGNNSTPTLELGVDALFSSLDPAYFEDAAGAPLNTYLPLLFGVADASVNLQSVAVDPVTGQVIVTVKDNGGTAEINIPEPASIALVGVALLGLGVSGRRFKAKKSA